MFRDEVAEILEKYKGFKIYERNAHDIADEVCTAAERMGERMPRDIDDDGCEQWWADQEYIRKETSNGG